MSYGRIADIAFLALAAIIVISYTRRGFFSAFLSFGRGIAAAILAWFLKGTINGFFRTSFVDSLSEKVVNKGLNKFVSLGKVEATEIVNSCYENKLLARVLGHYRASKANLLGLFDGSKKISDISPAIIEKVANDASKALAFLIFFIGGILVITIVFAQFSKLSRNEYIRPANRALGLVFGLGVSALVIAVIGVAMVAVLPILATCVPQLPHNTGIIADSFVLQVATSIYKAIFH